MSKFITEHLDTLEGMLLSRKINYISIPYSHDKYRLDIYGQIFNNEDNSKVEVFEKDNTYYVNLDWVNGVKDYNLAKVIIVACRPNMMLPSKYFEDIIPLFRNGDSKNISPDNLTYDLPKPGIEVDSENFPGFYYIPEHTSYAINKGCQILRIKTKLVYTPPVRDPKDKIRNNIKLTNDQLYVIRENLKIDNGNRIVATKAYYVTDLKTGEKTFWLYPRKLIEFLNISDTLFYSYFKHVLNIKEFTFHNRYKVSVIRLEGTMPI